MIEAINFLGLNGVLVEHLIAPVPADYRVSGVLISY